MLVFIISDCLYKKEWKTRHERTKHLYFARGDQSLNKSQDCQFAINTEDKRTYSNVTQAYNQ